MKAKMKKFMTMVCTTALMMSLVACGATNNTDGGNNAVTNHVSSTVHEASSGKEDDKGTKEESVVADSKEESSKQEATQAPTPEPTPEPKYVYKELRKYKCVPKGDDVTKTILAEGEYDSEGNLIKEISYVDGIVSYVVEALPNGQIIKVTDYDAKGGGKLLESHSYDERGNEVEAIEYSSVKTGHKFGYWWTAEYNADDNMIKQTKYNQDQTIIWWKEWIYNGTDLLREVMYDETGIVTKRTEYEYENGKLKKVTSFNKSDEITGWIVYEYDGGNGEKVTTYTKEGNVTSIKEYAYDVSGNVTKDVSYDKDGNIESMYEYGYDASGNQIMYAEYGKNGVPKWYREYSSSGQKIKEIKYLNDGNPAQEKIYDEAGNKLKYTEYEQGGVKFWEEYRYVEQDKIHIISYNANNEITSWVECDKEGEIVEVAFNSDGSFKYGWVREYDETGRVVKKTYYPSSGFRGGENLATDGVASKIYEYKYDEAGRLVYGKEITEAASDDWIEYEYKYDEAGHLVYSKETEGRGSRLHDITECEYKYDVKGNKIAEIVLSPDYEKSVDTIVMMVTSYKQWEYDADGNMLKSVTCKEDGTIDDGTVYEYDVAGNCIKSITYKNGKIKEWYETEYIKIPVVE